MPELPEVETVRRSLEKRYLNKLITSVEIIYPKMIKTDLNEFVCLLSNVKITSVGRKGKYLLINLSNNYTIISHLRMEGKYTLLNLNEEISKHAKVVFYLDDNTKLCYEDSRCFGVMYLVKTNEVDLNKEVCKVGIEPFDIKNPQYLYDKYHRSNKEIKALLLDQSIMAGLGNIYCDEVLFKAKINPYKKGKDITLEECQLILNYSIETLNHAINLGGSTVSSYHPEKGIDGKFQNELLVYGKKNQLCVNCSSKLMKDKLQGRGTTYCPKCQNVAISIGLTGKIASGKSTVLKMFEKLNAKIFSADEEVNKLYKEIEFKKKLIILFGERVLNDDLSISKGFIKSSILSNPIKKKELESLVHPEIKNRIVNFIHKNKESKLIVIEVPLLFEAKLDSLFDYTVGVNTSLPNQIANLKNRGVKNIDEALTLNKNHQFDKNIHKCDFVIDNNESLKELEKQVKEIYSKVIK